MQVDIKIYLLKLYVFYNGVSNFRSYIGEPLHHLPCIIYILLSIIYAAN